MNYKLFLLSAVLISSIATQTPCPECGEPFTKTKTARPDETGARPKLVFKSTCDETFDDKHICYDSWKDSTGGCCTTASIQSLMDWMKLNFGAEGKVTKELDKEVTDFEAGTGDASKAAEVDTANKKPGVKTKRGRGANDPNQTKEDGDLEKAKARGKGDKAKKIGAKAKKLLKVCLRTKVRMEVGSACGMCSQKARDLYDATVKSVKASPEACKQLFKDCAATFLVGNTDVKVKRVARGINKNARNKNVAELATRLSTNQDGLMDKLAEKNGETTDLENDPENTKNFCAMVIPNGMNPAVFGDGNPTDTSGATQATRRLLGFFVDQQRRILQDTTEQGYVQASGGVGLSSDTAMNEFLDSGFKTDDSTTYARIFTITSSLIAMILVFFF